MIFEIGKYYKHTSGICISILGEVITTLYGRCFVAEQTNSSDLRPVGMDEVSAENWSEIDKADWLSNFS